MQESEATDGVLELDIASIDTNENQPRKKFDNLSLKELAASISEKGIIQPIIVEPHGDRYKVVAGERRYRAAKIAGLDRVPAIVRKYGETERLQISLIENIQRENLNPIEEASAYDLLMKQADLAQEDVAGMVGKSRSAIANSMRLLKLAQKYKDALIEGTITSGHARAILSLANPAERDVLYERIVRDGISVREAEAYADRRNKGGRDDSEKPVKREETAQPEVREVEQRLIESLGTKVKLNGTLTKGRIEISYFSKADLERLFDLLAGD
jgi:ParB family chromosome partitioning protein